MLRWQRKGVAHKITLYRRILAITCLGHAVVCILIFMVQQDGMHPYSRELIETLLDADVTIEVLPFQKTVHHAKPSVSLPSLPKKQAATPAPTTLVAPKKEVKSSVQKTPEKKVAPTPKKVEAAPPKKDQKEHQTKKQEAPAQKSSSAVAATSQSVHVGQREYDALLVQQEIQQEVQRCWQAPIGISPHTQCKISVCVCPKGKVVRMNIEESSGILLYDAQAQQSIYVMQFPRATWGKEVIVYFKQS